MSAWAKPGVKCVCVNDENFILVTGRPGPAVRFPVNGGVYTIGIIDLVGGEKFLGLTELGAGEPQNGLFHVRRFRPLAYKSQSLEHDIAKFKDVARHARAPEGADA